MKPAAIARRDGFLLSVPARGLGCTLGLVDGSEKPDSALPVSKRNNPIGADIVRRLAELGWVEGKNLITDSTCGLH